MATIADILLRQWPGRLWTIHGDDYATLSWDAGNPEGKPAEAEIRAFSATVDSALAAEVIAEAQQSTFLSENRDAVLTAVSIMIDFCAELYRVMPQAQKTAFDATVLSRGQALKTKIEQIRAG